MYKVRFHLGAGVHFKHWQIRTVVKGQRDKVEYFNPEIVQLELVDCTLRSNTRIAKKVLKEQVRDVCGWVECQSFTHEANISVQELPEVVYDPKINPYWKIDGDSDNYEMIRVNTVVSGGKRLYILKMGYEK